MALYATVQVALRLYLGIRSLNAAPSAAQKSSSSGIPSAFVGRGEHARRHVSEVLSHHLPGMLTLSSDRGDGSIGSERTKDPVSAKVGG